MDELHKKYDECYGMIFNDSKIKDYIKNIGDYLDGLKKALPELERLAGSRDPDACFIIGRCYETGSIYEPDIRLAMKFYTRAAGMGNTDAMFNLGCIYMKLIPGGEQIALDYFQRAVERGCVDAKNALKYYEETKSGNDSASTGMG